MGFRENLDEVLLIAEQHCVGDDQRAVIAEVRDWHTSQYTKRWRVIHAQADPFVLVGAVIKRQAGRRPHNHAILLIVRDIVDGMSAEDAPVFLEMCGITRQIMEDRLNES